MGERTRRLQRKRRCLELILVTLVIYVTFDLNQPHKGLIRVSQDSLERVVHAMEK
jgi:hypothetical protein